MRGFSLLLLTLFVMSFAFGSFAQSNVDYGGDDKTLDDILGHYRIVAVCEKSVGSEDPPLIKAQFEAIETDWQGHVERDVAVFWMSQDFILSWRLQPSESADTDVLLLTGGQVDGITSLRNRFDCNEDVLERGEVMLIGKDETVKLRRSAPVSISELFSLIDAMPMRLQEMQAQ